MKKVQKRVSEKKAGSEPRATRKQADNHTANNSNNSEHSGYSTYVFANTPLNMEDEERNPDCCW